MPIKQTTLPNENKTHLNARRGNCNRKHPHQNQNALHSIASRTPTPPIDWNKNCPKNRSHQNKQCNRISHNNATIHQEPMLMQPCTSGQQPTPTPTAKNGKILTNATLQPHEYLNQTTIQNIWSRIRKINILETLKWTTGSLVQCPCQKGTRAQRERPKAKPQNVTKCLDTICQNDSFNVWGPETFDDFEMFAARNKTQLMH